MSRVMRALAAGGMMSVLSAAAVAAASPATVGELLDAGGKQLTKKDIMALFSGATVTGTAMGSANSKFLLRYRPDGSASGDGWTPRGSTTFTGRWFANDRDQYCQDLRTAGGAKIQGCFYYFAIGKRLFAAPAAGRGTPVYERRLMR